MGRMVGLLFFITLISGCATTSTSNIQQGSEPALAQEPITNKERRTIVLDGEQYTENKIGDFITWGCGDFVYSNNILIEVGIFSAPELSGEGFILFDGSDTGELTLYWRDGIDHRWSWGGGSENEYSFTINPSGGGLYYNFSEISEGESTGPADWYSCVRM